MAAALKVLFDPGGLPCGHPSATVGIFRSGHIQNVTAFDQPSDKLFMPGSVNPPDYLTQKT